MTRRYPAETARGLLRVPGIPRSNVSRTVPRLAYSPDEAAQALGVSRDYFDEHVGPELRIVRRGRRRLIPVDELTRWLAAEAALTLGERQ